MNDNETNSSGKIGRRPPWNKGKLVGAKPPLRPSYVWSIRTKLQMGQRTRHLALFNLAIDSKLRGCDVVAVRVDDVAPNGYTLDRATVRQKKTGRPVRSELTEQTRQAIDGYLRETGREPAVPVRRSRRTKMRADDPTVCAARRRMGRKHRARPPQVWTHSMRRTKATLIYRRTGNLQAVQLLLGHTKIESTVRYLGIEIDDAIEIAEKIEV